MRLPFCIANQSAHAAGYEETGNDRWSQDLQVIYKLHLVSHDRRRHWSSSHSGLVIAGDAEAYHVATECLSGTHTHLVSLGALLSGQLAIQNRVG